MDKGFTSIFIYLNLATQVHQIYQCLPDNVEVLTTKNTIFFIPFPAGKMV